MSNGFDDERFDDEPQYEAEFLPALGGLIPSIAGAVLPGALGGLFGQPPRPPLRPVSVTVPGGGTVSTGRIDTPRGSATVQLPADVATQEQLRSTTDRLESAINRNTARLNTVERDLQNATGRIVTEAAKAQKDQQAALARLRREQASQNTTNLMMSLMFQRRLQTNIEDHLHTGTGGATSNIDTSDNTMLMLLPMFMSPQSGQDGTSGDSGMNTMMMMLALTGGFGGSKK